MMDNRSGNEPRSGSERRAHEKRENFPAQLPQWTERRVDGQGWRESRDRRWHIRRGPRDATREYIPLTRRQTEDRRAI